MNAAADGTSMPVNTHSIRIYNYTLRSYFFGDKSPKGNPTFYIKLIQKLCECFRKTVRAGEPGIPLVVNTCGWTSGECGGHDGMVSVGGTL